MASGETAAMLLEAIGDLPNLGQVVARLSRLNANPGCSAREVVDVVKLDPALAAKVLRVANSAYVGIPRSIDSLKNAVVLLGQKRVHSLALASGVLQALGKRGGALPFRMKDYWRHSVAVGMVAEAISNNLRRRDVLDGDEAFTAGLLHDIGKLAAGCFGAGLFREAAQRCRENNIPFFQAEESATSHTAIGRLLAGKWNFPQDLCDAIACHHCPGRSDAGKRMASIVHLSDGVAHLVDMATVPGETPPQFDPEAIALVDMQPERLRAIADESLANEKRIESLMEYID